MIGQITQKFIKEHYDTIISIPYCKLQFLLKHRHSLWCTVGRYGWNADIYSINGVAIVTGYKPFGNVNPNDDTLRKYNDAAQKIRYNYDLTYDEKRKELDKILNEFIEKVTA